MYLCGSQLALPGTDAVLKWFFERWEGHALCHDDVVIQQLGGLLWAPQDVRASLLVWHDLKHDRLPFFLHLVQSLQDDIQNEISCVPVWFSLLQLRCFECSMFFFWK